MKRTRYQMLVGLLLCGLFGFSAAGFGAWRELEPIPTGRWGLAAAAVGDTVYAIAGQDDSPKISKVEAFDIAKGKWEESKEIPQGRVRHAAVTFRGKIYVFGGTFDGIAALGSVQEYDPKNNAWTNKADMPTPRIAPMVVAMSSNIYVIGGATDLYFPSPAIEVYNPTTDTWEKKADMPNPRWGQPLPASQPRERFIFLVAQPISPTRNQPQKRMNTTPEQRHGPPRKNYSDRFTISPLALSIAEKFMSWAVRNGRAKGALMGALTTRIGPSMTMSGNTHQRKTNGIV